MYNCIPFQIYELPNNKWEYKYQGVDELPKVDYIDRVHKDGNYDSYDGFIGAEFKPRDGSGNPQLGKVLKCGKGINGERIGSYHKNPFLNTQE